MNPASLLTMMLRGLELICAAVVAGITGAYLSNSHEVSASTMARFYYTEALAGVSILTSTVFLLAKLPPLDSWLRWNMDATISALWFIAFGLILAWPYRESCGGIETGKEYLWSDMSCGLWRADEAFAVMGAACWALSAVVGIEIWCQRVRRETGSVRRASTGR